MSLEYRDFVAREATAGRVELYHALCVPGILQTEAYARAATAAIVKRPPADPFVTARVEIRMERQRVLAARGTSGQPPQLVTVLDEAVLCRPVGGRSVMRAQLDRLAELVEAPTATVVIVPLELAGHPGLGGTFELLTFSDPVAPHLVFVESAAADFIVDDPAVTESYRETIAMLTELGRTGAAAQEMINRARGNL
jgi:hypothetical protein